MTESARERPHLRVASLVASMAAFIVVGAPLVAYLWEILNEVMAGRVTSRRIALALPVLALFVGLLALLARAVSRWEAHRCHEVGNPVSERAARERS